ncbi:UNVERIFIED_CONTAM: hypothetical protein HDU68_011449 [Siphonaria sp. JEL0065]|nr:hypothetical protein HDU68_011449 [Siphonaria sp. JEL0065]
MQKAINTIHLYLHYIDSFHLDQSNAEKFAYLFEEGASFSFPHRGLLKTGRAEFKSLCEAMGSRFKGFNHLEYNIVLEEAGDGVVKNMSYWSSWDQDMMTAIGKHYDTLALQEDGKWLFRERLVTVTWTREEGNIVDL